MRRRVGDRDPFRHDPDRHVVEGRASGHAVGGQEFGRKAEHDVDQRFQRRGLGAEAVHVVAGRDPDAGNLVPGGIAAVGEIRHAAHSVNFLKAARYGQHAAPCKLLGNAT